MDQKEGLSSVTKYGNQEIQNTEEEVETQNKERQHLKSD